MDGEAYYDGMTKLANLLLKQADTEGPRLGLGAPPLPAPPQQSSERLGRFSSVSPARINTTPPTGQVSAARGPFEPGMFGVATPRSLIAGGEFSRAYNDYAMQPGHERDWIGMDDAGAAAARNARIPFDARNAANARLQDAGGLIAEPKFEPATQNSPQRLDVDPARATVAPSPAVSPASARGGESAAGSGYSTRRGARNTFQPGPLPGLNGSEILTTNPDGSRELRIMDAPETPNNPERTQLPTSIAGGPRQPPVPGLSSRPVDQRFIYGGGERWYTNYGHPQNAPPRMPSAPSSAQLMSQDATRPSEPPGPRFNPLRQVTPRGIASSAQPHFAEIARRSMEAANAGGSPESVGSVGQNYIDNLPREQQDAIFQYGNTNPLAFMGTGLAALRAQMNTGRRPFVTPQNPPEQLSPAGLFDDRGNAIQGPPAPMQKQNSIRALLKRALREDPEITPALAHMRGWQWKALGNLEDEGEQNWMPRVFTSEATPISELLASPAKQGILHGVGGALLGGAAGFAGGSALGQQTAGTAAGAGIGALLGGIHGYGSRRAENDRISDALRRLPPGAVMRDWDELKKRDAGMTTAGTTAPAPAP